MLVAIHQPNFLPWLGWFDKLAKADCFVLLDTAAHQLGGSNYTNRVQILAQGSPRLITVPVMRGREERSRIDRLRIAENGIWRRKLHKSLEQAYARARFFEETMALLEPMLAAETQSLCELNLLGIHAIAAALRLPASRMVPASALAAAGDGTDRLVALVRAVGGDAYLTGHGAGGYQEDEKFAAAGIRVVRQNYGTPPYPQIGAEAFVPGLSAVDALMNCGDRAGELVGEAALTGAGSE
jgi:WbqC-like protein family